MMVHIRRQTQTIRPITTIHQTIIIIHQIHHMDRHRIHTHHHRRRRRHRVHIKQPAQPLDHLWRPI